MIFQQPANGEYQVDLGMSYIFPISFFLNYFSMTILMVGLSLIKHSHMAADVGIVQGATVALFYTFSANGRNVILNPSSQISIRALLISRLLLLLPLGIIAFYLSAYVAHVAGLLAFALILRSASEWLCELCLSDMELRGMKSVALKLSVMQLTLLVLVLGWMLSDYPKYEIGLFAWALLPLIIVWPFICGGLAAGSKITKVWRHMVPHLGSTAVIGITIYVFRLLILEITGKEMAGDLYAAFAIGGLICSIYARALGPTLVLHEQRWGKIHLPILLKSSMWIWFIIGVLLFIGAQLKLGVLAWTHKPVYFWEATGISMIGGVLMIFAQQIRLQLLQLYDGRDVYGPDVLSNILLIAIIPYLYYLAGENALICLFLISALLNMIFYISAKMAITAQQKFSEGFVNGLSNLLPFLLFFPLFFQLTGNIFHNTSFYFNSKGILRQLPIPISVLACYMGIILFGSFRHAYLSLGIIFLTFIMMLTTSLIPSQWGFSLPYGKIILLFQFILPMFALVLGQMYEIRERNMFIFEKIFLYTTAILVPVQLICSWLQHSAVLTSDLYVFSIYQHLEYVSVIVVCCYLLALFSLWESTWHKNILIILSFIMGIYAVAAVSMSTILLIIAGVAGFAFYRWRLRKKDNKIIWVLCLVIVGELLYLPLLQHNGTFMAKFAFLKMEANRNYNLGESTPGESAPGESASNLSERLYYWEYYSTEIMANARVFLLGHTRPPNRSKFPSAHNYYLDFIYNFGLISILPLLALIGYTLYMIYRYRRLIYNSSGLLGLTAVVVFLLLAENSVKVGLREPYSGIMTFFLWGVLLSRLMRFEAPDFKEFASLQPSARFDKDALASSG